jgi:predicted transcriptional regulator
MAGNYARVTLDLPRALHRRLKHLAVDADETVVAVVRRCVEAEVDRRERKGAKRRLMKRAAEAGKTEAAA